MPEIKKDEKDEKEVLLGQIHDEVKSLVEKQKPLFDDMRKDVEVLRDELSATIEQGRSENKEKIEKLQESIISKQEEMDKAAETVKSAEEHIKAVDERIDELETKMDRPEVSVAVIDPERMKDAVDFQRIKMALDKDLKPETDVEAATDLEVFKQYEKSFHLFLRKMDDFDKGLFPEQRKDLYVGSDPDGGYLVPPTMSRRVTDFIRETSPIRTLASIETIASDRLEMMVDIDQAGAGWSHETVANAATTTPQWRKIEIPAHWQEARPRSSQQLIDDAVINVETWLANKVAQRFARLEATAFVVGTGVGQPTGFLTYPNAVAWGSIEQVVSRAAATITGDGIWDLLYHLKEEYANRSTFLVNRLTARDIMLLKDGAGNYLWQPSMQMGEPMNLCARPLRWAADMPVIAAGALSIALADWSETYLIVDRAGISVQRDPFTVKPMVEYFTRKRVGGDVVNFDSIKIQVVSV